MGNSKNGAINNRFHHLKSSSYAMREIQLTLAVLVGKRVSDSAMHPTRFRPQ